MNEAHRLWDENSREIWVGDGPIDIMLEKDFIDFFSKYNPWITDREPTREDGYQFLCDIGGCCEVCTYDFEEEGFNCWDYLNDCQGWPKVKRWMRIPK